MPNTLLYYGTEAASHAVILGGMHVLDGPPPEWALAELLNADRLVLESNSAGVSPPFLPNGARLSLLFPEVAGRVAQVAEDLGQDPSFLDPLLPLITGAILSSACCPDFRQELGMESLAGSMFTADQTEYLETALDLFSNLSHSRLLSAQVAALGATLDRLPICADALAQAATSWRAGDLAGVWRAQGMDAQLAASPRFGQAMFADRHRTWAPKAVQILRQADEADERVLFVVGAAHLMEPDSFQDALAGLGYRFEVAS